MFATLKKLRQVEASSEIKKLAHELFLESIILYATDMTPGKLQLHQLITFFKIIGFMKTTEWISSKVLCFSISNGINLLRKYNSKIFEAVIKEMPEFSSKFNIADRESAFEAEVAIMLSLLINEEHVGPLNEVGLRVLEYSLRKDSTKYAAM